MFSVFVTGLIYIYWPAFPTFSYYALKDILYFKQYKVLTKILIVVLGIPEIYTLPFAWSVCMSFDVAVVAISNGVINCMKKLKSCMLDDSNFFKTESNNLKLMTIYKNLQILLVEMNLGLSNPIFVQMSSQLVIIALLLYGSIHHAGSFILLFFFLTNAIFFIIRIFILFLPMAKIYEDSQDFIKFSSKVCQNTRMKKYLLSLKPLYVMAGTSCCYKITHHCIFHYVHFITSNTLVLLGS